MWGSFPSFEYTIKVSRTSDELAMTEQQRFFHFFLKQITKHSFLSAGVLHFFLFTVLQRAFWFLLFLPELRLFSSFSDHRSRWTADNKLYSTEVLVSLKNQTMDIFCLTSSSNSIPLSLVARYLQDDIQAV